MSKVTTRILCIIAGVLLVAAGVAAIADPGGTLEWMSVMLGIVMLFSGISDIAIFASARRLMYGSGWFLINGILTVLMSMFILFDQAFTALTLPFVLGMWLLLSGISVFANSFDLQAFGVRGWGWFTFLGVIMTVGGFVSFIDPLAGAAAISWIVGLILILEGAAFFLWGCFAGRLRI